MRKFVVLVIVALTVLISAPASAVSWTVTPGGNFTASGVDFVHEFDNGATWWCDSISVPSVAVTAGNPVAVIPETPGVSFIDCIGPGGGFSNEYTQIGDWEMHAESYDPVSDVVTGTIHDVAFSWIGPACDAVFGGTLDFRYHNTSGLLEILPNQTLTDIQVDPELACFGLLDGAESASFDVTLSVTPIQRIVAS